MHMFRHLPTFWIGMGIWTSGWQCLKELESFSCTAQGPAVTYMFFNVEDIHYFMVMTDLAYWEGNIPF